MDGIRIGIDGDFAVVQIDSLSPELEAHIESTLSAICRGQRQASEDSNFYSFERTKKEFVKRFSEKPPAIKIGMSGELVVHLLATHCHSSLTSAAVYFNKEERSIKKGYDLMFYSDDATRVWYGEVKSGEVPLSMTSNEKARALLNTAANDVAGKLSAGLKEDRWDSAIIDAGLAVKESDSMTVKDLLRKDLLRIESKEEIEKNVFVAAVVIHEQQHCAITEESGFEVSRELSKREDFTSVRTMLIQQESVEMLVHHLRDSLPDASNTNGTSGTHD